MRCGKRRLDRVVGGTRFVDVNIGDDKPCDHPGGILVDSERCRCRQRGSVIDRGNGHRLRDNIGVCLPIVDAPCERIGAIGVGVRRVPVLVCRCRREAGHPFGRGRHDRIREHVGVRITGHDDVARGSTAVLVDGKNRSSHDHRRIVDTHHRYSHRPTQMHLRVPRHAAVFDHIPRRRILTGSTGIWKVIPLARRRRPRHHVGIVLVA